MMQLIVSDKHDIADNLALEQELMEQEPNEFLLLYTNRPCVVVGRFQTPEAEIDLDYCKQNGIKIVQRLSGGGTVYHDEGNVNYAFILNREGESPLDTDYTKPIINALLQMGLPAIHGERNQITINGYKVSGTASYFHQNRVIFHGTLLFDCDLTQLERALQGNHSMRSKVKSVPAKVANILSFLPQKMDVADFFTILSQNLALEKMK